MGLTFNKVQISNKKLPDKTPKVKREKYKPVGTGWVPDLDDEDYFSVSWHYRSSTGIMGWNQEQLPAGAGKGMPDMEFLKRNTSVFQIGTLIHTLTLSPEIITDQVDMLAEMAERFPSKNGKAGALEVIKGCVRSFYNTPEAVSLIHTENAQSEYAGFAHGIMGYPNAKGKIKCDSINLEDGYITDVKTSAKSAGDFENSLRDPNSFLNYTVQSSYYMAVANAIQEQSDDPRRITGFRWVYISKKDYSVKVIEATPEMIENGGKIVQRFFDEKYGKK